MVTGIGVYPIKSIFTQGSQSGFRVLLLLVFSLTLMVMDKHVAAITQFRTILSVPLASLQYLVSWPIELVDKIHDTVSTHDSLVQENLDLKAEQLMLRAQVQRLIAIESENNQLKALVHSSSQLQGKVVIAQLLAVSADPFLKQVILNKGSHDNVYVGQPVLDANGVMGQVTQVDPLTSRILLINDVHSGISVEVVRNGIRAIAVGDIYSGQLHLLNVPQTVDIQNGDVLITSGLGEHFPEGYPVGRVISVTKDPGLQFTTITVSPSAHLDRSRGVLLVWPTSRNKL
jgi:rod shape-determining protein MreC